MTAPDPAPHKRRPRYAGKNPRRFEEKYKELDPARYAADVAKVLASGKTPAGTHRPIMVAEILEALALEPGDTAVDCTLGYGGHAREMLAKLSPGGRLIGLDVDDVVRDLEHGADDLAEIVQRHETLRTQLGNQQLSVLADAYMEELRSEAIIKTP